MKAPILSALFAASLLGSAFAADRIPNWECVGENGTIIVSIPTISSVMLSEYVVKNRDYSRKHVTELRIGAIDGTRFRVYSEKSVEADKDVSPQLPFTTSLSADPKVAALQREKAAWTGEDKAESKGKLPVIDEDVAPSGGIRVADSAVVAAFNDLRMRWLGR